MFDDQDPNQVASKPDPVEDIFTDVNTDVIEQKQTEIPEAPVGAGRKSSKLIVLAFVFVIVVVVIASVIYFFTKGNDVTEVFNMGGLSSLELSEDNSIVPYVLPPVDTDGDGLTDDMEIELGTDPFLVDTDSDEVSDYDEINTWGTIPTNPDSDGDTYLDGVEITGGFNPKGEGKLMP